LPRLWRVAYNQYKEGVRIQAQRQR